MKMVVDKFKGFAEMRMFGVFSHLGEKMGIASGRIRMFFVYISFLTFGSPIFIYLAVAFILNIRNFIRSRRRNPIWDF